MKKYAVLALAALGLTAPALAHHSMAMFDGTKTIVLVGTVKEMQWTNPHAWLQVMVAQPGGPEVEWSFEMEGPNVMQRSGWKKTSVKPGDKVTVTASPLKDGRPGGAFINITLADGSKLGREIKPAAPPAQ